MIWLGGRQAPFRDTADYDDALLDLNHHEFHFPGYGGMAGHLYRLAQPAQIGAMADRINPLVNRQPVFEHAPGL